MYLTLLTATYLKHVSGPLCVFFAPFGYWVQGRRGGVPRAQCRVSMVYSSKMVPSVVPSNRPCFERQIVQDEALYKCRLLHFEDPALESRPWHEVAVGVGRNLLLGRATVGPGAFFSGVHRSEYPMVGRLSYQLLKGTIHVYRGSGIDAGDRSGNSVSLSTDGNRLAIGALSNDGSGTEAGHTRVYQIGAFFVSLSQTLALPWTFFQPIFSGFSGFSQDFCQSVELLLLCGSVCLPSSLGMQGHANGLSKGIIPHSVATCRATSMRCTHCYTQCAL